MVSWKWVRAAVNMKSDSKYALFSHPCIRLSQRWFSSGFCSPVLVWAHKEPFSLVPPWPLEHSCAGLSTHCAWGLSWVIWAIWTKLGAGSWKVDQQPVTQETKVRFFSFSGSLGPGHSPQLPAPLLCKKFPRHSLMSLPLLVRQSRV